MKENKYLFIIGMNSSGTTVLQNLLSQSKNCISFIHDKHPHGIEGQAACFYYGKRGQYPRDVGKYALIWTEVSERFDKIQWEEVKKTWHAVWAKNKSRMPPEPVYLEKTPFSVLFVDKLIEHFKNSRFILIHRNPYAICESLFRGRKRKRDNLGCAGC